MHDEGVAMVSESLLKIQFRVWLLRLRNSGFSFPPSNADAYERTWEECEKAIELNDFVPKADPYREIERVIHDLMAFAK